jgi:putative endonuclease
MFNKFFKNSSLTYQFGMSGEEVAVKYLKGKGYKILERNYKNKSGRQLGEIDIIAQKDKELFFVEVKTRTAENIENILPEQNINPQKLKKLAKIAQYYVRERKLWNSTYHFDAVSVLIDSDSKRAKVRHLRDIFF